MIQIQWYPWQLFVRKWALSVPLALAGVLVLLMGLWLWLGLRTVNEPIFLHYSVELGVDAIGSRARGWWVVLMAALVVAMNTVVSNALLLSARTQSYIIAYATVPLVLALMAAVALMLRANGV